MAKTTNDFDDSCIWNFGDGIEILDQTPGACLVKMVGHGDNIDNLLKRSVGQPIFVRR